jgi:peptidoglycan/LPS O-acetylase OafA/YrhL
LGWIQYFAAGILLADLYSAGWGKHWIFDVISILLWPAVFIIPEELAWILLPWVSILLCLSAFRSFYFQRFLSAPVITMVGGMCYSVYLVHLTVILLVGRIARQSTAFIFISIFSIVVVSLFFFIMVERPCMNRAWPSKLLQVFNPNHVRQYS